MKNIIKLKKTLLSFTFVFILTFSLLPTPVRSANGDSLLIGGVDIIKDVDHKIEYSNGGYVKYDIATQTLELNNAIIKPASTKPGITGKMSGTLTINVIGNNSITLNDPGNGVNGINVEANAINMNGTDKSTSKLNISIINLQGFTSAINCNKSSLSINNMNLEIESQGRATGIDSKSNELKINNSNISMKGLFYGVTLNDSNATFNGSKMESAGITYYIYGGASNLTINDCSLDSVSSTLNSIFISGAAHNWFNVSINNSTINALDRTLLGGIKANKLSINANSVINLNVSGLGLMAIENILMSDSTIKINSDSDRYHAISSEGNIDIKDSTIDASGKAPAILVERYTLGSAPLYPDIKLNSNLAIQGDLKLSNYMNKANSYNYTSFIPKTEKELSDGATNASNVVKIYIKDADYSAVIAAINSMPNDLTIYTETSVNRLVDAITAVVIGKNKTEQTLVDQYAKDILIAIGNLEPLTGAPTIIDGNNQTITEGSEGTFRSDANINDFIKVSVDGKDLDSTNYTATSGSTIITLNKNYIATLSVGNHKISIVSKNGTATANFTIKKSSKPKAPSTGIANNSYMLLSIMLLSGVIIIKQLKEN
ncbi:MAG: hypothetical protein RR929_03440 [Erysipelotrichaceae bacterium]